MSKSLPLIKQKKPLILASGSKSRQTLLQALGLEFTIHPSAVDEETIKNSHHGSYEELALLLAQSKALTVSAQYSDQVIIGADQLNVMDNMIFDKPGTHERATWQLQTLNGKTHRLLTAVCMAVNKQIVWHHLEPIALSMRSLTPDAIERYLQLEKPYQSCGSYHFEGLGKWLFTNVSEHDSTIVGLPILPLLNALISFEAVSL